MHARGGGRGAATAAAGRWRRRPPPRVRLDGCTGKGRPTRAAIAAAAIWRVVLLGRLTPLGHGGMEGDHVGGGVHSAVIVNGAVRGCGCIGRRLRVVLTTMLPRWVLSRGR